MTKFASVEERREWFRKNYAYRRAHDPEWWERRKAQLKKNQQDRLANNPEYRERCREREKKYVEERRLKREEERRTRPTLDLSGIPLKPAKPVYSEEEKKAMERERIRRWGMTTNGRRSRLQSWLRKKFGIGFADYEQMYEQQGGACAICGDEKELYGVKMGRLQVDHCHGTKENRGLLCFHCNTGLGHFRDHPDLLEVALTYLRSYEDACDTNRRPVQK